MKYNVFWNTPYSNAFKEFEDREEAFEFFFELIRGGMTNAQVDIIDPKTIATYRSSEA